MDCTCDAAPAIVSYPLARALRKVATSAFETLAVRPVARVKIDCDVVVRPAGGRTRLKTP